MRADASSGGGGARRCAGATAGAVSAERHAYWDQRHREGTTGLAEPSLVEMLPLLPRGRTLDIAAGLGRNAIALAKGGMCVIAVDYSERAGLALLQTARDHRLAIEPVIADIEDSWPFRPASFDLVVNINFLNRSVVPRLTE